MCPYCSRSFKFDPDTGLKESFTDHFIVPNSSEPRAVKDTVIEWLKRLHHRPDGAQHEFFVTNVTGILLPFWIVSLEGHTYWKGLVSRKFRNRLESHPGAEFLVESGQFRRSFRWAVSARQNLCEFWGLTRLHEPLEAVSVDWDGFPLDSTFTRGRLVKDENTDKSVYDAREFFEFKLSNGLNVAGVQVNEEEALRRARQHVELFHYKLSCLNVDYLVDIRTEFDIAGIQLMHLPFWQAKYIYQPQNILRHFHRPVAKTVLIDGFGKGILKGELAVVLDDKVKINAYVCAVSAVFLFLLGFSWHGAFYLVGLFACAISIGSFYKLMSKNSPQMADPSAQDGGLSRLKQGTESNA
jgi:hypothetical protein